MPENYHHVTSTSNRSTAESRTRVTITQDGNADQDAADHSAANWQAMLELLQKVAVSE